MFKLDIVEKKNKTMGEKRILKRSSSLGSLKSSVQQTNPSQDIFLPQGVSSGP
jgi:hypothetical protein